MLALTSHPPGDGVLAGNAASGPFVAKAPTLQMVSGEDRAVQLDQLAAAGEDRSFGGNQLFVDLVPQTCFFSNVRSCVTPAHWKDIRKFVIERALSKCEICGDTVPLQCHERWAYANGVQKLVRLIALCQPDHEVTHFGLARIRGRAEAALARLMFVNQWTQAQAQEHLAAAEATFLSRSQQAWDLDLSILEKVGVPLKTLR